MKDYNLHYSNLTVKEENKLINVIYSSKSSHERVIKAKRKIVLHNLKFIIKEASNYFSDGLEIEDIIHEGVKGVYRAFDSYDKKIKVRFMTHARYWICKYMSNSVYCCGRVVALPPSQIAVVNKVKKAIRKLDSQNKNATTRNIAKMIKLSEKTVGNILSRHSEGTYEALIFLGLSSILTKDGFQCDIESVIDIKKIFSMLPKGEKEIVYKLVVLGYTLEEIGRDLKLSKMRISQKRDKILNKMKKGMKSV